MAKAKEIRGLVYRVRHHSGGWLVEVPEGEDPFAALAEFAAARGLEGYLITSVARIFGCSSDTPRVGVLSSREYKDARARLQAEPSGPPATMDELKDRIDSAGWSCSDESGDGGLALEIGKSSPAGEDFHIYITGDKLEDLVRNLGELAHDFDEDDHVRSVMDSKGAPGLAALVKDSAAIHRMLEDLADAVAGR
ncbi:hypothetical protein [uncultured Flavonifractor sp.]|uniref:hypothetical protein n=1 Tax=uncultured Flavonifractor sp. TaxID=1193534 RepID=UPI0025933FF4|nr:hypothetical protein [uncultured Flavonifractor sp.]